MKFEILADGNLEITIDAEAQKELQEMYDCDPNRFMKDETMYTVFEFVVCNGLSWVDPSDIGAMTEAPILGVVSTYNEDTDKITYEQVFWYPDYCVISPQEELCKYGKVIFQGATD